MSEIKSLKSEEINQVIANKFNKIINDELKRELEETLRSLASDITQEVLKDDKSSTFHRDQSIADSHNRNIKQVARRGTSEKAFTPRNSLLLDLFEISHIKTIYNVFIVILILLFLNSIVYDLVDRGTINIGLSTIIIGFGKIKVVAATWMCMQLSAVLPYSGLKFWAKCRSLIDIKSNKLKVWDAALISLFVLYQILLLIIPIVVVSRNNLPIGSAAIVLLEMIRFMMKSHAYVRSVSPRILNNSPSTTLPSFSWYMYFLFAPTLIYRDIYPRTKKIQWGLAAMRFLEVIAVIFYVSFLTERFLIYNWAHFGRTDAVWEAKQMVLTLFGTMLPALLTFLCCFYLLLHSWHNATAEILRFADRRFYMDWWNQSDYAGFYRTWNMIVHDWLYTYIYRDIILLSSNRLLAQFFVFFISAIFHEIAITFMFGFFYPVLLIMFGVFGLLLVFITKHINPTIGNIFMWLTLAIGNGVLWAMYGTEYFARINCPMTVNNKMLDFIIPRSWFCHQIVFTPNWKFNGPFNNILPDNST